MKSEDWKALVIVKLKSDQVNPEIEYLTTVSQGHLNIQEVLEQFGTRPVVLIAVAIMPQEMRTGKLEKRGAWIHALWSTVRAKLPALHGCRLLWSEVFFMAATATVEEMQNHFRQILLSLQDPELESRCILATANGTVTERARLLDDLQHDLQAPDYYGYVRFPHRLCNGMDWPSE